MKRSASRSQVTGQLVLTVTPRDEAAAMARALPADDEGARVPDGPALYAGTCERCRRPLATVRGKAQCGWCRP